MEMEKYPQQCPGSGEGNMVHGLRGQNSPHLIGGMKNSPTMNIRWIKRAELPTSYWRHEKFANNEHQMD